MTLKEELEILRGEPIKVFEGDPMDIPCIETSDSERLCKNPVVSVHMVTYNHEPYIRQAIEGVMMQKADFEFELVIGEDASTDNTREICFEYQKRYPDKIRVLWWHENLRKVQHPAGANGKRNMAHCRGEFIAFCEGDDYWIDPLKLQKQVDIMRKHPDVGLCFCNARLFYQNTKMLTKWWEASAYEPGVVNRRRLFLSILFGINPYTGAGRFITTATFLIRRSSYDAAVRKYEILSWRLRMGDTTIWLGISGLFDGWYIPDVVSVYRISNSGICGNPTTKPGIIIDGAIVRLYYAMTELKLKPPQMPSCFFSEYMAVWQLERLHKCDGRIQRKYYKELTRKSVFFGVMLRPFHWLLLRVCLKTGNVNTRTIDAIRKFHYMFYVPRVSRYVKDLYIKAGVPLIARRVALLNNPRHLLFRPFEWVGRIRGKVVNYFGLGSRGECDTGRM